MKMKTVASVIVACLCLGGCSGFKSSAPPPTLYMLHAAKAGPQQPGLPLRVVSISEPSVPQGFETNKIVVYLQQDRRMDYAAGAVWPGPFPKVLQDFILQSAGSAPGVMAVAPDSGIPAAFSLTVSVNDFEPVYAAGAKAAPLLKASLTFTLLEHGNEKILSSFTVAGEQAASANTLTAITFGLEALAQQLAAQAFQKINFGRRTSAPNNRHRH